ncbi:MAG: site-specific DNA-methyltransferase, partial [Chloroflexi bacterium]|nr:site-specific DNA-methyltransferase [Chloroflexota bacterium]
MTHLKQFTFSESPQFFARNAAQQATRVESVTIDGRAYPRFINEFWTAKQRQASSLHEIAYRACFKPQLPRFFIERLTCDGDIVYDPFAGRGTTIIEAALMGRNVIGNDINPLSQMLTLARLHIPEPIELQKRLAAIPVEKSAISDIDLSMFFHPDTLREIVSLRDYLRETRESGSEDALDAWIRMVATNRLTGHSRGFFSVYTLPPNQAVSRDSQRKINSKRKQKPEYRDTRALILKKSKQLISKLSAAEQINLARVAARARFLTQDAGHTSDIPN